MAYLLEIYVFFYICPTFEQTLIAIKQHSAHLSIKCKNN
jgi:hypothetical protein